MPGQDGVRADYACKQSLREDSTAEEFSLRRQPSSLVIGQEQALLAQMLSKDPILLLKVVG